MYRLPCIALSMFVLCVFSDCKKGEEDPLISLRTRKARLCGDWTLSKGNVVINYSENTIPSQENSTTTYDGSTYTNVTTQHTGFSQTISGNFSMKLSFKKDGTYSITTEKDGELSVMKGNWNFVDKTGNYKKAEQIVLHRTEYTSTQKGNTGSENISDHTFQIRELRHKDLVLVSESVVSNTSEVPNLGTVIQVDSNKMEYTFKQ